MKTKPCAEADRKGRARKARSFAEAADIVETFADEDDLIDAQITLCVHAGIAAADALCCERLGEHASGQNHNEALALLATIDKKLAADLSTLLGMKTRAGYSAHGSSAANAKAAMRATGRLVQAIEGI